MLEGVVTSCVCACAGCDGSSDVGPCSSDVYFVWYCCVWDSLYFYEKLRHNESTQEEEIRLELSSQE